MSSGFLPRTDDRLLEWARNLAQKIGVAPHYGLPPELCAEFADKTQAYADALRIALDPSARTQPAVTTKNEARAALKILGASLGKTLQANLSISDAQKIGLGLTVAGSRTKTPAPEFAPTLDIVS